MVEWARPSTRERLTAQAVPAVPTRRNVVTVPSVSDRTRSPLVRLPLRVRFSAPGSGTQPVLAALEVKDTVPPSEVTTSSEVADVLRISE
ncbi:hypothetical protein SALBM217S_04842 [Streptomyces griseoloalbus]